MYDDKVAIAIWAPQDQQDAQGNKAVAALAAAGYTLLVPGSGSGAEGLCRTIFEAGEGPVSFRLEGFEADWADIPGLRVVEHPDELSRLQGILTTAEALVLMPGDMEAMAALMQVWAWGHRRDGAYRPVLLLGPEWPPILQALGTAASMSKRTLAMVTPVADVQELMDALRYCVSPTS